MKGSEDWCQHVKSELAFARELAAASDSDSQRFEPGPALEARVIDDFEKSHAVSLPADFRAFLTSIGHSGFGPDYGLLPLAAFEPAGLPQVTSTITTTSGETFSAGTGPRSVPARAGKMSEPFLLKEPWRPVNTDGTPSSPPIPADCNIYDGCLGLTEIGCGYQRLLVLTGDQAGTVWVDYTAGDGDLAKTHESFRSWIGDWLSRSLLWLIIGAVDRDAAAPQTIERGLELVTEIHGDELDIHALNTLVRLRFAHGDQPGAEKALSQLVSIAPTSVDIDALNSLIFARDLEDAESETPSPNLVEHSASSVRAALAANPDAPTTTLRKLCENATARWQADPSNAPKAAEATLELEALIDNPSTDADTLDEVTSYALGSDSRIAAIVLRALAFRPETTAELVATLSRSSWPEVRHAVASRSSLDADVRGDVIDQLLQDPDDAVRAAMVFRPELTIEQRQGLEADPSGRVRRAIAGHSKTSRQTLVRLAHSNEFHYELGRNPALPDALASVLALLDERRDERSDDTERSELVGLPPTNLPAWVAIEKRLFSHQSFPVALVESYIKKDMDAYMAADHPWLLQGFRAALVVDPYSYTRSKMAHREDATSEELDTLLQNGDKFVRATLASREAIGEAAHRSLLDDAESGVREGAARNPLATLEMLATLAADSAEHVRRGVARNPNAPADLLEKLSKDESEFVREWTSKHPSLSSETRSRLANDDSERVAKAATFAVALSKLASTLP